MSSVLINLITSGIVFILPMLFSDQGYNLVDILITNVVELPGVILAYFLIDNSNWGRKRTIYVLCLVLANIAFINFAAEKYFLLVGVSLNRCFKRVL